MLIFRYEYKPRAYSCNERYIEQNIILTLRMFRYFYAWYKLSIWRTCKMFVSKYRYLIIFSLKKECLEKYFQALFFQRVSIQSYQNRSYPFKAKCTLVTLMWFSFSYFDVQIGCRILKYARKTKGRKISFEKELFWKA